MRYNKIRKMDISNGEGVRVSIFFQGCIFHCKNCFNKETWDFNGGYEFNQDVIDKILELCDKSYITGLSILGGEPLHKKNVNGVLELVKKFREKFKQTKTIWLWSGFLYEDVKDYEVFSYIDVFIDGRFMQDKYIPNLKWKGSSNQRVIDVKKTKKNKKIVLYC